MPFVLLNGILDGFSTVTLREHLNGECLLIITVGNMEFGTRDHIFMQFSGPFCISG